MTSKLWILLTLKHTFTFRFNSEEGINVTYQDPNTNMNAMSTRPQEPSNTPISENISNNNPGYVNKNKEIYEKVSHEKDSYLAV